jgi:hypothetical protein
VLALLMEVIYAVHRCYGLRWHQVSGKSVQPFKQYYSFFPLRNLGGCNVGITDGIRCHVHTEFHIDRFRHSKVARRGYT